MYLYETHLHTSPISACGKASVRETMEYYRSAGYAGIFMTDHFIDANFDQSARHLPYDERIRHYFSAYEEAREIGEEIGLSVFPGFEMAEGWTHILVYGIGKEWCLAHPDMDLMKKSELMTLLRADGALLIQAHPFRDVEGVMRLYPKHVHGVEVYNSGRGDFENEMAAIYCQKYGLIPFAGSDNHHAGGASRFGGIATERPIQDHEDFLSLVLQGEAKPFMRDADGIRFL